MFTYGNQKLLTVIMIPMCPPGHRYRYVRVRVRVCQGRPFGGEGWWGRQQQLLGHGGPVRAIPPAAERRGRGHCSGGRLETVRAGITGTADTA